MFRLESNSGDKNFGVGWRENLGNCWNWKLTSPHHSPPTVSPAEPQEPRRSRFGVIGHLSEIMTPLCRRVMEA